MGKFITVSGLQQLRSYKYQPGEYTPIDRLLNPYWLWVTDLMPHWLAPNVITLIGVMALVLAYAVILVYDQSLSQEIPGWCFLLAAVAHWVYHTLDAVDGKQARRTNSSSPLGQLFDHGCDSIIFVIMVLIMAQAGRQGGYLAVYLTFSASFAFWTASWLEHKAGVLMTSVGVFGVTQGIFVAILFNLISAFMGQQFWQVGLSQALSLPDSLGSYCPDIKLGDFLTLCFCSSLTIPCVLNFLNSLRIRGTTTLFEFSGYFLIMLQIVGWYHLSVFQAYQGVILISFGMLICLVISKTIICSVTKMNIPTIHWELLPSVLTSVVMLCLQCQSLYDLQTPGVWVNLGLCTFILLHFVRGVISQLTQALGIKCFSIACQDKKE